MSYWNYRVLAKKVGNEIEFSIYEVYYDDDDNPESYSTNPRIPVSYDSESDEPIKSLDWVLSAMKKALKKPIIDYDNFPNLYKKYYRKRKLININKTLKRKNETK